MQPSQTRRRQPNRWTLWLTLGCALAVITMWSWTIAQTSAHASSGAAETADLPNVPKPITSFGAAVVGDWLYLYSGHTGRPHRYSKEDYDHAFRRLNLAQGGGWQDLPPGPSMQGLAFVAHGGKLYRVGGLQARNAKGDPPDLHSTAGVARFDPAAGRWETLTPMPEPRSSHDAVVVGDKLYVVGGWDLQGDEEDWHRHALVADLTETPIRWRRIDQPFRRRALAAATLDGKVLAIGGFTPASKSSARLNIYDPTTGKWARGQDVPTEHEFKLFGGAAFVLRGHAYANGGDGVIYRLDEPDGSWTELDQQLKEPRFFHRMVPWRDDRLLFIAGAGRGGFLDSIELVQLKQAAE